MTKSQDSAAAFPFQRPGRLVRALFKTGAGAYRGPLAPGIATQWDRYGPPRPLRWMLRRFAHFDYDAEVAHAVAHAEDLPMVELVPRGSHRDRNERGRT